METDTDSGWEDEVQLRSRGDGLVKIAEELQLRQQRGHSLVADREKGLNGAQLSETSEPGLAASANNPPTNRKYSTFNQYKLPEFSHVKSKVDTGLGFKRPASVSCAPTREQTRGSSNNKQKRSDPLPPTTINRKNATASFKVPDQPLQLNSSNLSRNSATRRSLTRLFSRNSSAGADKNKDSKSNGIRTPFGDVNKANNYQGGGEEKRSQFSSKRSITSLSLFSGSKKDEEHHQNSEVQNNNKERKNSLGRLRARSSLDLSSLGFGSISRASSKAGLTDLKEEADSIKTANKTSNGSQNTRKSDRPWFDLTRVWKDQTKDLPVEDMFHKMRGERAGRARTVPVTLESSPGSLTDLTGSSSTEGAQSDSVSHNTTRAAPTPATALTPGALKKTVTLLSPEVLTNWYERRKKEASYGPRRNSISNLFFQQDKKQSSPVVTGLRGTDNLRGSMLNLEEILAGEGVLSRHHRVGKGIQRSESAKLTNDSKLERYRWRGKGIQRSESARLINMRQPSLQPRQNSHPNLVHQTSYSSSTSSLADRSSLESHSFQQYKDNPVQLDSDLEAEADPPEWRHEIPEEDLKKLSSKELKRQDVINEFFHTEKSHVRNLKVLDCVFRRPLMDSGRLSREFVDRLFPNLDEVLAVHQNFNCAMKSRVKKGFPIGDICDILTEMFLESNGDQLVTVCGEFTKNQNSTIDELKRLRSRDTKLEQFLSEIERNPACRRLQLQALLPCEHQRLVKYPLLLREMAKYSASCESPEYDVIMRVTEKTKEIIDSIDKIVAAQQNRLRLAELQSNLDSSGLDKMGGDHPIYVEYKNLELPRHSLIFEGPLVMKLGDSKRVKSLHVLLLEDCMMLLQKQGEKFLLKFHSSSSTSQAPSGKEDSRRLFHSPIIKYSTMLVRPVATDKRAFYLLNTTERGPQIYELVATTMNERAKWMKHITEAGMKKPGPGQAWEGKVKPASLERPGSFKERGSPKLERVDRQNSSPPEGFNLSKKPETPSSPESPGPHTPPGPKKRLQRVEILKIVDSPPMVDPSQVVVNSATVLVADPVVTPLEKLKQKDVEVSRILEEKQKLISEILSINEDDFDLIADVASNNTESRDARDILLAALGQAKSLTSLVNTNLKVSEEDLLARSAPAREALLCPGGSQLVQITASMNHHLTDLLAVLQEKDEEREMLRTELTKCQDQIKGFYRSDSTRSFPSQVSQVSSLVSSRPNSFISIESDPADLSDQRPNSLLSFSSDNCVIDTDEETSFEACPVLPRVQADIDLTPTEETAPGPAEDSQEIIVTSSPSKVPGADTDSIDGDQRRFCLRNSVRPPVPPCNSVINSSKITRPLLTQMDLKTRRSKYSTFDRRREDRHRLNTKPNPLTIVTKRVDTGP